LANLEFVLTFGFRSESSGTLTAESEDTSFSSGSASTFSSSFETSLPSGNDGIFQVNVAVEEKELFFHKCFDVAFPFT